MDFDHIPHLYEDRTIKYEDMVNILTKSAKGELKGTEQTDGLTIFLGYKDGQPKVALDENDIKQYGLSAEDFSQKQFNDGEHIRDIFNTAFDAFSQIVSKLNNEQISLLFGKNGNIFLNAEILSGKTNIITYNTKIIIIHRTGHKLYNALTGEVEELRKDREKAISFMIRKINEILKMSLNNLEFKVKENPVIHLQGIDEQSTLADTIQKLQQSGFKDGMTINDYLFYKTSKFIKNELPQLKDETIKSITYNILDIPGSKTIKIPKSYISQNPEFIKKLKSLINNKETIIKDSMFELEDIIQDFSVEILNKLQSSYVSDYQLETERLKKDLNDKINFVQSYDGSEKEKIKDEIKKEIIRLKHIDKIQNPIKGFVFRYGDKLYKFTGNFSQINNILNIDKFLTKPTNVLTINEMFDILDEISSVAGGSVEVSPAKNKSNKRKIKKFNPVNEIFNMIDIYLKESTRND